MADKELTQGAGITLTPDPLLPKVNVAVDPTVVAMLADLADPSGATKIGTSGGIALQAKLDAIDVAVAAASGGGSGPGTPGAPAYVHTRYSNDGGLTFTASGGTVPGAYMGTYSDNTAAASASVGVYTWVRVLGNTGAAGPTGSAGPAGSTGSTGSTGAAGATGAQGLQGPQGVAGPQGIQGPAGANGQSQYFHVAYASNSTGTAGFNFVTGDFIGTYVDTAAAASASSAAYTWRQFTGSQGPTGTQGIPGVNGTNGQTFYLHVKYSNNGGLTFTGNAGEDGGIYRGEYVDTTAADSSSVAAYTWVRIQGLDGAPGAPGATGAAGTSVYTATIYIQQVATPTAPTGGTMNFSTGTLTPPAGWSFARPIFNSLAAAWSSQQTFMASNPGATVAGGAWTNLVKIDGGAAASAVTGWFADAFASTLAPASAACAITLLSDGTIRKNIGVTNSIIGNWYLPTTPGVGASYKASANLSGSPLTSGSAATGVAVPLTFNAGWGLNQSGAIGEKIATLEVKIINNATGLIDGSGTINLDAVEDA